MYSYLYGADIFGIEARIIRIEADVNEGLPVFDMVGFLASAVKEARERVRISLRNAGVRLPAKRITINLSPANLRKEGTSFDLPIALSLMMAMGLLPAEKMQDTLVVGELGLDGCIHGVPGVLAMILEGRKKGMTRFMVPKDNAPEGALVPDVEVYGVNTLEEVLLFFRGQTRIEAQKYDPRVWEPGEPDKDFSDVSGQTYVKMAAEIAVAGRHNLLMIGPPGSGKTMIASRIAGIMPKLDWEDQLEITRLYSICGLLSPEQPVVRDRPFRAPHHTLTPVALTGGGRKPVPGELSLASKGILFLDELAEFSRESLEVLRQPLEEKMVHISRVGHSQDYPCDCLLIAAMNPCPCGYFRVPGRCRCTTGDIRRYLNKISEPLLDRLDLCVETELPKLKLSGDKGESSMTIRERVTRAVERQKKRYEEEKFSFNGEVPDHVVMDFCKLGSEEERLVEKLYEENQISMRQIYRMIRVSRTIADLKDKEDIHEEDLMEAFYFRSISKQYWGEL